LAQRALHGDAQLGGMRRDGDARGPEGCDLLGRGPLPTGDDRPGVSHPLAPGWRLAGDEPADGLRAAPLDEGRRLLLRAAADLADHDDAVRARIVLEETERVEK